MELIEVFIAEMTEVDISENCCSLFMAICRSNISPILIALPFDRIFPIFDFACWVRRSISSTRTEKSTPVFLLIPNDVCTLVGQLDGVGYPELIAVLLPYYSFFENVCNALFRAAAVLREYLKLSVSLLSFLLRAL